MPNDNKAKRKTRLQISLLSGEEDVQTFLGMMKKQEIHVVVIHALRMNMQSIGFPVQYPGICYPPEAWPTKMSVSEQETGSRTDEKNEDFFETISAFASLGMGDDE